MNKFFSLFYKNKSMKKYIALPFYAVILATTFIGFQSCDEDLPTYYEYTPYEFASLDENGGTWKPNLLASADQIGIPAPTDAASAEYQAELAALKSTTASLTSEQKAAVEYWGGNGLIRWNEIAREMSAKYNLAPAPNPDGSYPAPNPAEPGIYPLFPFAHPPYSCRAFAYWASAQYDALIAAWHYKYQFNRPAPYNVDGTIVTSLPQNDLPGYPSEGAVIAAVSKDVLSALYPLEAAYIAEKAEEHKNSLIWAGMNVASDIAAGDSLGRAVGKVFRMRAANDGMKNAQTPRLVSDSIRDAAEARWGWHWVNQETPPRPVGITPKFSAVKLWILPNVESVRPPVPPAPGSPDFQVAAAEMEDVLDNLTNDERRIANFWSDGLGTYTPPGHWNRFACESIVKNRYNPLRAARTMAYLNMAMQDAGIACWDAKYYYHYPRPVQAISGFKTILGTPNFPSYTSGHSMFSSAASEVLSHIFPEDAGTFEGYADEAGVSRLYGGIHYRFDIVEGKNSGKAVGQSVISRMQADGGE